MQKRQRSASSTTRVISLGELLRAARKALKLTFRETAEGAGVSHGFIADLEAGRRSASDDVLDRIADVLDVDPATLRRSANAERLAKLEQRAAKLRKELQ